MRKGGKGGSKGSRQRKHIEIKQSRQISPVREVPEPEESAGYSKVNKISKRIIAPLSKLDVSLTEEQIQSLSSISDRLVSVELLRLIIHKQEAQMRDYYKQSPPIVQQVFQKVLRNVESSLDLIKQQRIETIKLDNVAFVVPDRDLYERQKGKQLNNLIKQQMLINEQKQNFKTIFQQIYQGVFIETEQTIKRMASEVPRDRIDPCLEQMVQEVNDKNSKEIDAKLQQIKCEMAGCLDLSNDMAMISRQKARQERRRYRNHRYELEVDRLKKAETVSMAIFSIQDYFY